MKLRSGAAIAALMALSACGIFKAKTKTTPVLGARIPILASEDDITVDKTIKDVRVTLPAPTVNPSWAQPGGSAAKSGGSFALNDNLTLAWSARIPGSTNRTRLAAAPVVADGHLYVMDTDGVVHAFAADTGKQLWTKDTDKSKADSRVVFGGGVSYSDGRLFATNGIGEVIAMDASDGKELWRQKPGGPLRGSPTVADGNVYVLSQDNQLFALSYDDGHVVWTQSGSIESQGVFGVAAPAAGRGSVIAGFSSGELNAYRYENGRNLWGDVLARTRMSTSVSSLVDIDADPVLDNDQVYAIGQGGRMVALDILSGRRLWEQNISGGSTPWVAGNWIFVVTDNAKLLCMARDTGKIRWIAQLPEYRKPKKKKDAISWVGPVLAGNKLLLTNNLGQVTFVEPTKGMIGKTMELKGSFYLPPVVANNMLYLLTDNGDLKAYR
nr:PQQ-binding-like beta-propeller repeat protein [Stakelama sediminis]